MAFNNDQLGDAGRDYYAQQFDGRIKNIRKPGAAPPSGSRGSRGKGGAIGGGVLAVFVLIRIFAACAGAGNSSSSYNSGPSSSYDFTPPPAVEFPPPPVLNNNGPDNPPWRRDLEQPIVNPPIGQDNPGVEAPDGQPARPDPDLPPADPDKDR